MSACRAVAAGLLWCGLAASAVWAAAGPSTEPSATAGESIYQRGVVGSGAPLEAIRKAGGLSTKGADAACVNCHQRSGLGATEGRNRIPPIAGRYLFHPRARNMNQRDLPYVEGVRADREPYTEATLARAIREGLDSEGRPLSYLMPRFRLNDADMAALIEYLKTLDARRVPGVTDSVLHFATVVTPDADPVKRGGMLDVMEHYFAERNTRQMVPSPRLQASGKTMYADTMYMVHRQWQLHVWELTGQASTWKAQLAQHLAKEPVLAVISGLGGTNWAPVHEFCEQNALPCLFPNVEVPVDSGDDFYTLYFSKGVLLEAELIARKILGPEGSAPVSAVVQVFRAGDCGEAAAKALAAQLKRHGVKVRNRVLASQPKDQDVAEAVREATGSDALILWLRPADVAALGPAPASPTALYLSGLMGGLERAPVPADWRSRAELAYPFDLPEKRRVRVDYPLGWFTIRRIPIVAEQVQVDTYLACGLLSEVLSHMVDNFTRAYLIERLQTMMEHRILTGYYPRLTLATHQHFASKGGYITRFADASGARVVADGDWLVP
jgi:mono/diheme cytochrome c family protein